MIGYMAELGVERTLWTPGASRLELTLTEDHLNKGGVAHGGIHMLLLDSALGSALVASLKVEEWCATAQLSTSFLAAAGPVNAWWRKGVSCDAARTWRTWRAKSRSASGWWRVRRARGRFGRAGPPRCQRTDASRPQLGMDGQHQKRHHGEEGERQHG